MEGSRLKGGHPEYNFGCIWREMQCKLNNALFFPFTFFMLGSLILILL